MVDSVKKLLQNSSFLLLIVIGFALVAGHKLPASVNAFFYALSLSLKEILLFLLPVVIFTYLSSCILSLRQGALTFVAFLVGMVVFSNLVSILTAYLAHFTQFIFVDPRGANAAAGDRLNPLWMVSLPKLIRNDHGMFLGLFVGLLFTYTRVPLVEKGIHQLKRAVDFFMNRLFIPVLPLFILGFVLKLKHEGILGEILEDYTPVFGVILLLQIAYLSFLSFTAARFHPSHALTYMRNVFPAMLAAFTTMSSAAAMPMSIRSAERNTGNPDMARAVIPATLNIHLIGDSLAIPIMIMVILRTFGFEPFTFYDYLIFTGYFMIGKFAVAAVPGGTILVMVPVLEARFGFTPEMSALITALYILFDPVISAANVWGNGAFAIIFERVMGKKLAPLAAA